MRTLKGPTPAEKNNAAANTHVQKQDTATGMEDQAEAPAQPTWQQLANNSPQVQQLKNYQAMANNSRQVKQLRAYQVMANDLVSQTAAIEQPQEAATAGPAVQRMLIKAPVIPPETDANGVTTEYEDDAPMDIDSTGMMTQHIPDEPESTVSFMLKKLSLAWSTYYSMDLPAQYEIGLLKDHLKKTNARKGYGDVQEQQRTTILAYYNALVLPAVGIYAPSFQNLIKAKFETRIAEITRRDALYSAQINTLLDDITKIRNSKAANDANSQAGKSAFHTDLVAKGAASHALPAANRYVSETGKTHGGYTVGNAKEVWVSVHGAVGGEDVVGWESSSDLNYKYGLVHAHAMKLVAGHLLPAWLGGLRNNNNLTPIPNEANAWLATNPEKAAKSILFSDGACLKYEVACTFARDVPGPLEADVAALVPSGFNVKITRLKWNRVGDSKDWANYEADGVAVDYPVPVGQLLLDHGRMADGVRRGDLDRSKLKAGMS